jgi:hypothetical protein
MRTMLLSTAAGGDCNSFSGACLCDRVCHKVCHEGFCRSECVSSGPRLYMREGDRRYLQEGDRRYLQEGDRYYHHEHRRPGVEVEINR